MSLCDISSLEVILRAEAVEMVQAGDKCDFTGTLIAIPDVAQLAIEGLLNLLSQNYCVEDCSDAAVSSLGARTETSTRVRAADGHDTEGVRCYWNY